MLVAPARELCPVLLGGLRLFVDWRTLFEIFQLSLRMMLNKAS